MAAAPSMCTERDLLGSRPAWLQKRASAWRPTHVRCSRGGDEGRAVLSDQYCSPGVPVYLLGDTPTSKPARPTSASLGVSGWPA